MEGTLRLTKNVYHATQTGREGTCRVTMPLRHSEAERLPHPGCWPLTEAQIICLQRLHVLVGTGQAPQGLHP